MDNLYSPAARVLFYTNNLELKSTPSPNGKFDWIYANRPAKKGKTTSQDAVVIAPVIHHPDGDSILFLRTNRVPITAEGKAKGCLELPAGLVGDENSNESIEDAIKKETLEETGYLADNAVVVNEKVASSPGCVSETSALAIVDISNTEKVIEPVSDGNVIQERIEVPLKDVQKWIKEQGKLGYIATAQALAGLYYVSQEIT